MVTAAFDIQTDIKGGYVQKLAQMVYRAETKFYQLFQIQPGFIRGDDPKTRLDPRIPEIKGDQLSKWKFRPWIEIRIYQNYKDYVDEWFDESDRLRSLVDKKPIKKETPEERAIRRLREGVPGAYYMRITDYDGESVLRRIRAYVGNKTPEELEMDILHEMGHCFMETFLFEFGGAPRSGMESEKRGTPAWMGEGVAQLFQYNWAEAGHGAKEKLRNWGMIFEAVQAGHSYPFGEFINVTNAHNLAAVAGDPLKARINYVQSFSVMQYMVEANWQMFMEFLKNCRVKNLQAMGKGKKVSELYTVQEPSFKEAFTVPIGEVEKLWKAHVEKTGLAQLKRDASGWYYCGEYWLQRNDLEKASERFQKAIEGAPSKGEGFLGMGRVALKKNDIKSALEHFAKAVQLSPKDEDAWFYQGIAMLHGDKHKEAAASFAKALEIFPNSYQACDGLAEAQFALKQYKEAGQNFDKAYQISRMPQFLIKMGRGSFYAQEYAEAQRNFAAFCNVFTQDADGKFWYGMAAWRLGDAKYAANMFQEASKLQPQNNDYKLAMQMVQKNQMIYFQNENKPEGPLGATNTNPGESSKTGKTAKTDVVEEE
ncbi:MAG: tetratricopeptide repeat protein [Planctomycetota bacterium]|nr:tetratricopeptide repeat protein [Planctomycetota bacterium]